MKTNPDSSSSPVAWNLLLVRQTSSDRCDVIHTWKVTAVYSAASHLADIQRSSSGGLSNAYPVV
jgi:hypothetical protein